MIYNNIWISSIENIERLHEIISKTPKFLFPFFGAIKIGKDVPYVKMAHYKIPVLFESFGTLKISENKIHFSSQKPEEKFKIKYQNIKERNFELDLKDIETIDYYHSRKTYFKTRNFPWVCLNLKDGSNLLLSYEIQLDDFDNGIETNENIFKTIKNYYLSTKSSV